MWQSRDTDSLKRAKYFFNRLVDWRTVKKQTGKMKMEPRPLSGQEFVINFRLPLFILVYHIFFLLFRHTVDLYLFTFPFMLRNAYIPTDIRWALLLSLTV